MVVDALVYHPSVTQYLKFLSTAVGRDKVVRLIQYFSRFYAWYLYRTNATPAQIAPFDAIKKQFSLARKLMRIGKNVEHLKAAAVAADAKSMDPVLKYCAVGRQLGYAGYLSFDAATYLDAAGISRSPTAKSLARTAYKFWVMGLLFNTTAGIYTLYGLRQKEAAIDKKDGESAVESKRIQKERSSVTLQLISDLCDLTIPTTNLGWSNLDDGIVGLAGTTSSFIGLMGAWKKAA